MTAVMTAGNHQSKPTARWPGTMGATACTTMSVGAATAMTTGCSSAVAAEAETDIHDYLTISKSFPMLREGINKIVCLDFGLPSDCYSNDCRNVAIGCSAGCAVAPVEYGHCRR